VKSRLRALKKLVVSPIQRHNLRRILCEQQTYYEKTYCPNPGDPNLRHGFVVLYDRCKRARYHNHDDTYGSRDAHPDQHQHYRDSPERRLLGFEIRIVWKRRRLAPPFPCTGAEPAELGRRFGFLFNCLTNDRRDRL